MCELIVFGNGEFDGDFKCFDWYDGYGFNCWVYGDIY